MGRRGKFVTRHLDRVRLATLLLALVGCRGGANYLSPLGPRYAAPAPACGRTGADLRIVTYNVAFARKVDQAIRVLRDVPDLADADIVLLQEMTADATARIATALGTARAGTVEAGRSASDHSAVRVRIPMSPRLAVQPSRECTRRVSGTLAPPATSGAPT